MIDRYEIAKIEGIEKNLLETRDDVLRIKLKIAFMASALASAATVVANIVMKIFGFI